MAPKLIAPAIESAARATSTTDCEWSSPLFTGRVIAAFLTREDVLARTGEALDVEELARQYGIVDQAK